ncbi:MAG: GspH/FimT family pseudopilin [Candidatus Rokubacteria bacterium]|nr:GspH/FimT family pseudopilin [Candidatus Rokubacteria bacterium]
MPVFCTQGAPRPTGRLATRRSGLRLGSSRGFTLIELIVVIAVIGIISVTAVPMFLSFLQAQQTRGAAQQVVTLLNQARQLAITRNTSYQVQVDTTNNRLRFVRTSDSTAYVGAGTDANGYMTLANETKLTSVTANPVFTALGAASTAGTITVQNAQGTSSLSVAVSLSGRIKIQ